eukprot:CAMPEP_0184290106 /NCGR_PEP_ID=MMETSP1049-20130417/2453_1 /TAXON_ID=77928 /ORGANISM="Proteomonas sulcata, Strain CCMP704" /LENGTH=175 /DNA_ID=CAMNT_0026597169 /DNA_START=257 /DNA_END=784 /DNA_ORIENTATION=-
MNTFDASEYARLDDPDVADMHQICDKLYAFRGPAAVPRDPWTHSPMHFVQLLHSKGVTTVVRLNGPEIYDRQVFLRAGFNHYDIHIQDSGEIDMPAIQRFMHICDETDGPVAVHCGCGLGRTGTMIALYLMRTYEMSASEALGWLRIVRPGSVIGRQQLLLQEMEFADWNALEFE